MSDTSLELRPSSPIRKPAHAGVADLFLGAGSSCASSWRLELSRESRRMLDQIGGGDPLAEAVILQGALALLLHRYGATVVDLLSPPLQGRPRLQGEDRLVQLRYAIDESMNGRNWLLQSRQVASAAYSGTPGAAASANGIAFVRDLRVHAGQSGCWGDGLCFSFGEEDGRVYRLDDPVGLLPPMFAPRLAEHFDAVLQGLADLDHPIADIQLCSPAEVQRLAHLGDGGAPRTTTDTLVSLFGHWARVSPGAAALIDGDRVISFGELERDALRLAYQLAVRLDVAWGECVAIAATRSTETVVSFLGVMLAGAAIMPFDPAAPPAHVAGMLEEAHARVLLLPANHAELAVEFPGLLAVCPALEGAGWEIPRDWTSRPPEPRDLAALIFTSGSEGRPKGVLLSQVGLANTVVDHVVRLGVRPGDRCVQFMAPFFDGGLLDIFTPLAGGGALVCPSAAALADPEAFHVFLAQTEAALLTATPAYLAVLDPSRLPALRVLVSAAEQARVGDFRRLASQVAVFNGYGPTEASVNTTLYAAPQAFNGRTVPIGRPSAGKRLQVVDPRGRLLPQGVIGEIVIRGAGLAEGYLNDPARTADLFPTGPDGDRHYRTGDLAAWSSEDELHFLGRRDQQVKIGGRRVELGHIERALFELAGVRDAAVVAVEGRLLGFLVTDAGASLEAEETLRARLVKILPEHMVPAELHRLKAMPRKSNGKVDGDALAGEARAMRARRAAFRVRSATEAALLEIWREALQMEEIDEEADFFRLGGDSIRVIQAVHTARTRGFEIDAADLIDHRTLRSLAQAVEARLTGRGPAPVDADLSLSQAERAALPRGWSRAFPVSGMQGLMLRWYGDAVAAANGVYHCLARWELHDIDFRPAALTTAARALARRHPILRTSFAKVGSKERLVQSVLPEDAFVVRVSDLTDLTPEARASALAQIYEAERLERFRLGDAAGPFARLHLVMRSVVDFDVILAAHHAVMDGWSSVTLENDFADFYQAAKHGKLKLEEVEPGPSFVEFVAADLQAAMSSAAAAFWRERWRRLPDALGAATAPHDGGPLFANREAELHEGLVVGLVQAARRLGLSPKATCLAAFLTALKQQDGAAPCVGVVTNGRSVRLTDPIGATGLFWNITPFGPLDRSDARVVQVELEAMAPFETYPLAAIVQAAGRDELFDTCFNFIQMHHARSGFGGLEQTGFEVLDRFHYGLTLFVDYEAGAAPPRCGLRLEYRRDRCKDERAERILGGFTAALAQILTPNGDPE